MPVKAAWASVRAAMEPGRVTVGVACAAVAAHSSTGVMACAGIMSATGKVTACCSMTAAAEVAARSVASP
jgi:hypothetical protein